MNQPPQGLENLFSIFLMHFSENFELSDLELEMKFARKFFDGLKFCYDMPKGMQIQCIQVVRESYEDCLSLQSYTEGALQFTFTMLKMEQEQELRYIE